MRSSRPLLIALPAFLLGALVAAALVTTAQARPPLASAWEYRVVRTESQLIGLTREGWEYVGESAATEKDGDVDRRWTLRKRG